MREEEAKHFVCLSCGTPAWEIHEKERSAGEIIEGSLNCASCKSAYSIVRGIPRFVSSENYAQSFGFQWNLYRTTQLDSATGVPISRERVFSTTGWPTDLTGQRVLEAGSGAGRFTEVLLSSGAEVFSFDYSDAVDANRLNNGRSPRLHLFQGDIYNIPLPPASFDKVLCFGVLQHTPDPEAAVRNLARYVRPGGELVVDCYKRSLTGLLRWKYVLRPVTVRLDKRVLHKLVTRVVPPLLPVARLLRTVGGRVAVRLLPIVEYSDLGLQSDVAKQWAILDTFDMYSPAHDHPQSVRALRRYFCQAGLEAVSVTVGGTGYIAKGGRALTASHSNHS